MVIGLLGTIEATVTGCKTSPEIVAYRSVGSAAIVVNTSLKAYATWVAREEIAIAALPAAERGTREADLLRMHGRVVIAYGNYQRAMAIAKASQTLTGSPATTELAETSNHLINLLQEVTK